MLTVAGALALLMLMLAVIQSVLRQDVSMLIRAAFGYLPMAFILSGGRHRRDRAPHRGHGRPSPRAVVTSLGSGQTSNLLQSVGDAYKNALDQSSGIPLFGVFLGAIILAIGAFVLWLEMIIRDAAIYICVFFLPLTFVAMIWPATSRWARRLVEFLVAIILSKFVIVAILSLASAAITNTSVAERRQRDVRADDRRRCAAGPRSLVAVRASPADPDDGGRRRQRRRASAHRCPAPRDRPASRALRATCGRRWTGTHGRRPHRPTPPPAGRRTGSRVRPSRAARRTADAPQGESAMRGTQATGRKPGASSSSSGGTVYPTAPAARRDSLSGSPRAVPPTATIAARVGHALAASDATAPTPRAAASDVTEGAT